MAPSKSSEKSKRTGKGSTPPPASKKSVQPDSLLELTEAAKRIARAQRAAPLPEPSNRDRKLAAAAVEDSRSLDELLANLKLPGHVAEKLEQEGIRDLSDLSRIGPWILERPADQRLGGVDAM